MAPLMAINGGRHNGEEMGKGEVGWLGHAGKGEGLGGWADSGKKGPRDCWLFFFFFSILFSYQIRFKFKF